MIDATELFKIFGKHRKDAIVVAGGMAGYKRWPEYSTNHKRDAGGIIETMGAHGSAALGIALAQPDQKVIVFDSEGSLLMNLGSLATTADQKPENLYHFLLDNGCYATTGGQPVPSANSMDYAGLAKDSGYVSVHSFDDLEDLAISLESILEETGPVFISVKTIPDIENVPIGLRDAPQRRSSDQVIADLREELGIVNS